MRPLLSGTGAATHAWSVGASEGPDTVLLDSMEEGITRLLTCSLCKRTQSEGVLLTGRVKTRLAQVMKLPSLFLDSMSPIQCVKEMLLI